MNNETNANLTPEQRKARVRRLRRKRRFRLAVVVLAFILVITLITGPVLAFAVFRVKDFRVEGESRYSEAQITEASGIEVGKSLVFVNCEKSGKSISTLLPYIEKATITKKLPGTVIIRIESIETLYALSDGKGVYTLASESLKVLESVTEIPEDAIVVLCSRPIASNEGQKLVYDGEDGEEITALLEEIISELNSNEFNNISVINLLDKDNIRVLYQNRLLMNLGDKSSLAAKINLGKRVIGDQDSVNAAQYGEINLTIAGKAYFLQCDKMRIDEDSVNEGMLTVDEREAKSEAYEEMVTELVTDENGETVTNENGENVTVVVTTEAQTETTAPAETETTAA